MFRPVVWLALQQVSEQELKTVTKQRTCFVGRRGIPEAGGIKQEWK
jgi:hypothetical protein